MGGERQARLAEILGSIPLFADLTKRQLAKVAEACFEAQFAPGYVILQESERAAHQMLVITDGTARVVRRGRDVATVGPGDIVGEMSLIDGLPRSASVIAETYVEGIVLGADAFQQLLVDAPSLCKQLLMTQTGRLRGLDDQSETLG